MIEKLSKPQSCKGDQRWLFEAEYIFELRDVFLNTLSIKVYLCVYSKIKLKDVICVA